MDETARKMDLARETVRRAVRTAKKGDGEQVERPDAIVRKLLDRFTTDELRALSNGKSINPSQQSRPVVKFIGEEVVIGFATDTHVGSKFFSDHLWKSFIEECKIQNVSRILFGGDLIEGMSNRPDQIYSLNDVGFSAQMDHAERLLNMTDIPIYAIDGNHDRWGIKSGGVFAVRDVANRCEHVTFLGHDMADVEINGTKWRLWHGEDSSSYATSYRVQKIIEAFPVYSVPDVLLCGHTHKSVVLYERGVCAISGGALSYQSDWMRAKRLPNHTGFHIIRATIRDNQIVRFSPTWYPFYK